LKPWWERLWLVDEAPINLKAARAIFALHAIWVLLSHDLPHSTTLPAPFWKSVSLSARLRYLLFPGHPAFEYTLEAIAIAALIAVTLGFRARWTCFLSAILLYHLAPLETFFWTPSPYERGLTTDLLALLTLSAVRWRTDDEMRADGWALRLSQFYLASIYLLAGLSKLRRVGFSWIAAENQRRWLLDFNQEEQIRVFKSVGPWVAAHPSLCWMMGIGGLLIDLVFVVAVFAPRTRKFIIPLTLAGHVGILLALNIFFINAPQLLVFVDWEWVRKRVAVAKGSNLRPAD
jgi:hypothetical protein